MRLLVPVLCLLALGGCEDVRRFGGSWAGPVSADPAHQQGFAPNAVLRATITSVSRTAIDMTVDLPEQGGTTRFEPIRRAADDALGEMRLDGEPLRTFIGYLRPNGVEPFLAVVSLFPEDRVDVRIIRGPEETYGVFSLARVRMDR